MRRISTIFTICFFALCLGCFGSNVEHGLVRFDMSTDGRKVVFSSAAGDLFLLVLGTNQVTQLTETDRVETSPSFSPDGTQVVFARSYDDGLSFHLFNLDLATQTTTQLTDTPQTTDTYPRFGPDGKEIVFFRGHLLRNYSMGGKTWDDWDVYVMEADGTNVRRLTNEQYRSPGCVVQRAGKAVIFAATTNTSELAEQLLICSPDSEPTVREPTSKEAKHSQDLLIRDPNLSPDGTRFLYLAGWNLRYKFDISVETSGGKPAIYPIEHSHITRMPDLADDNNTLLFLRQVDSNAGSRPIYALWKLTLADGKLSEVASDQLFTEPQAWKPSPPDASSNPSLRAAMPDKS
ncbi:hypothetical protein DTL21_04480 [Bremerella cremea]|uniref:Translocation protein TolB n=1 Tax=Blastopirellula marina TaxID=124 RepID=A0A2S8FYE0_9BACT|nr:MULTISPECIES: PD40 domain-containing protein [Pirellulaceae]PQO37209.1 hypothetical protein C5Y83_04480 [Blastopirellula marina]RCS49596.1 hypothetical protein DTL21_04480 [Bremerella cremea]